MITSGAVDIEIEEWQDEIGKPYPDDPIEVMPGVTVSKIATIKNLEAKLFLQESLICPTIRTRLSL